MSRQGPSRRERKINLLIDLIRTPPFFVWQKGPWFLVEEKPSILVADVNPTAVGASVERFDNQKDAIFCRDWKNAEWALAKIAEIERVK